MKTIKTKHRSVKGFSIGDNVIAQNAFGQTYCGTIIAFERNIFKHFPETSKKIMARIKNAWNDETAQRNIDALKKRMVDTHISDSKQTNPKSKAVEIMNKLNLI